VLSNFTQLRVLFRRRYRSRTARVVCSSLCFFSRSFTTFSTSSLLLPLVSCPFSPPDALVEDHTSRCNPPPDHLGSLEVVAERLILLFPPVFPCASCQTPHSLLDRPARQGWIGVLNTFPHSYTVHGLFFFPRSSPTNFSFGEGSPSITRLLLASRCFWSLYLAEASPFFSRVFPSRAVHSRVVLRGTPSDPCVLYCLFRPPFFF